MRFLAAGFDFYMCAPRKISGALGFERKSVISIYPNEQSIIALLFVMCMQNETGSKIFRTKNKKNPGASPPGPPPTTLPLDFWSPQGAAALWTPVRAELEKTGNSQTRVCGRFSLTVANSRKNR